MKITPKIPDEKANISQYSHLAEFLWLLGTVAIGVAAIYFAAGLAVDFVATRIPQEREAQWFPAGYLASAFSDSTISESSELQKLVDKLAKNSPEVKLPLRVYTSTAKEPNAFAIPGGAIVVTQGLLDQVKSENELAMVLGHEIGHFVHRHHLRGLGRGLISMFLSSLIGLTDGAQEVANFSLNLSNLNYTRKQEENADDVGFDLVMKSYGHVFGATEFFDRMSREDPKLPGLRYVSTHPLSADRVIRLHLLAKEKGFPEQGALTRW